MDRPAEAAREFQLWCETFDRAWKDPHLLDELECPSCGSGGLNLLYILDDLGAPNGMFAFWCGACLTGFPPGIGPVPDGAQRIRRGDERVPNYRLITDT
jgi:hypothetical protein